MQNEYELLFKRLEDNEKVIDDLKRGYLLTTKILNDKIDILNERINEFKINSDKILNKRKSKK